MNAVMKYPGAKWALAEWIIAHFPPHHSYLEPFFGSGAVLFRKPRSHIETVNDLDGQVVNLFRWIRDDPQRLADTDHLELLDALKAHRGPVLLSGYDSGLYREALKGWHREARTALAQDSSARTEILWMNFEPPTQESLFREENLPCQNC